MVSRAGPRHAYVERRRRNVGRTPERRGVVLVTLITPHATGALKMACPFCGHCSSSVAKSRGLTLSDRIRRRRTCAGCHKKFPTFEMVDVECMLRELGVVDEA